MEMTMIGWLHQLGTLEFWEALLEGFGDSGWAKIEVVRSSVSPVGTAFQPMAIVGDVPGADFALDDPAALADWIENQIPSL